ncbi:undecaprenyldiphospho-muramoylpentapeptide beta-N-acetylglucosaminyltransferase [Pseudodesulfovibrio portus]|uniref:UDP-N-acetylglucosamine--N-acetylmuramyl-(pentapeptide) pyrophosphoryl-undecaprenol N-acetylglucosamine transferase n=1 Tax=Pseudodesulfovibrio portus TaxID=231439 RepID=A0ABM8AQL0_9BACT|nr:undecaprenyldiphospho-muramoylpentapeptide beta-N-acetylglucosaminyltransferase [Pseudodesulfovibrio portus]BDQ33701.1 UDP-N-acetylglucosamine--N-acetylmuramyl-(pentapeptide) pyrophosphoryl-undecaprenol N-acetylglucosamine transferase [Pseudodesulfovibrio portus]
MILNRVILTTGGTGGHIFPALATATELTLRNKGVDILFMGGPGVEGDMARKHGLRFLELPASGIMGRGIPGVLSGLGWLGTGVPKALAAVWGFKPDAVIGFGGYAGFCPVLAARILGIPTAIHEQNSVPGVANKMLGKVVKRIFLSFPDRLRVFPAHKTYLTGNPVRQEILQAAKRRRGRATGRRVLVLGGSQGARPVNDAIIEALPRFMEAGIRLVHQAGRTDYVRVRAAYEAAGADPAQVREFIEDIGAEYALCDLAVCRAGASTVFEIAAAGVPAIFVPFPQATHDHQTMNAKAMADLGAAELIPQPALTGEGLFRAVNRLLGDAERLSAMEEAARGFAKPAAAADIVAGLEGLAA